MFTVRVFLMRDGYSDDGVKWDNVKLFLKTEEKPFNRVSGSDSGTWALAGSSQGDIFLKQKDKKKRRTSRRFVQKN
jgi:hypothetical protein